MLGNVEYLDQILRRTVAGQQAIRLSVDDERNLAQNRHFLVKNRKIRFAGALPPRPRPLAAAGP